MSLKVDDDDSLVADMVQTIREFAGGAEVTPMTDIWVDLDIDSLRMLELLEVLERKHHVKLESVDIRTISTPTAMAAFIRQHSG